MRFHVSIDRLSDFLPAGGVAAAEPWPGTANEDGLAVECREAVLTL